MHGNLFASACSGENQKYAWLMFPVGMRMCHKHEMVGIVAGDDAADVDSDART